MRKEDMDQWKLQASYTVEAAFVVPIIFFVIIFFFNYTFYCFDRAKLQSELNDIMRKASAYMAYEVDLETSEVVTYKLAEKNPFFVWFGDRTAKNQILKEYITKRLRSKYYITSVDSVTVETSVTKVKVSGVARMSLPILWFATGLRDYSVGVDFSQEASIFPREEKTRIMTAVIELGTDIKGVDKILNGISKFVNQVH